MSWRKVVQARNRWQNDPLVHPSQHPFSVYPDPTDPEGRSAVFMLAAGDWTNELHRSIERDSKRPVWIQGPFASPYAAALEFDHLVLIATGIEML